MPTWSFWDYVDRFGRNLVQEWYEWYREDATVQADFDWVLITLRGTPDWTATHIDEFKQLSRYPGLSELRFFQERRRGPRTFKRQFRHLGIWRPDRRDFVILLGCEKSGYFQLIGGQPCNAYDLAMRRKAEFEEGKGELHERL